MPELPGFITWVQPVGGTPEEKSSESWEVAVPANATTAMIERSDFMGVFQGEAAQQGDE